MTYRNRYQTAHFFILVVVLGPGTDHASTHLSGRVRCDDTDVVESLKKLTLRSFQMSRRRNVNPHVIATSLLAFPIFTNL